MVFAKARSVSRTWACRSALVSAGRTGAARSQARAVNEHLFFIEGLLGRCGAILSRFSRWGGGDGALTGFPRLDQPVEDEPVEEAVRRPEQPAEVLPTARAD